MDADSSRIIREIKLPYSSNIPVKSPSLDLLEKAGNNFQKAQILRSISNQSCYIPRSKINVNNWCFFDHISWFL